MSRVSALLAAFERRERHALARALTLVENDTEDAGQIMARVYARTGHAHVIGLTGPPGAGKSTLTNAMLRLWRAQDLEVAVLAVDPSSSVSGGATLGDRIRMLENWNDDGIYIRSMASRGNLGGLSAATGPAIHVLDAFGFDRILVETVGVGQAEVDISRFADTTVLLQVPGLGDSIQTIKAGVLEIADLLVVNKADIKGARELARDLRTMLHLGPARDWTPPIVQTVATDASNVQELLDQIDAHRAYLHASGEFQLRRRQRAASEVRQLALRQLGRHADAWLSSSDGRHVVEEVVQRRLDPPTAARLMARSALAAAEDQRVGLADE